VIYQLIEKIPGSNMDEDNACPDTFHSFPQSLQENARIVQDAYKLSEDFAKPYFHKY
jgi:hypothetical protein